MLSRGRADQRSLTYVSQGQPQPAQKKESSSNTRRQIDPVLQNQSALQHKPNQESEQRFNRQ